MAEKVDFLDIMMGLVDTDKTNLWFDDKQFKSIPYKLLVPPFGIYLYHDDPENELDNLSLSIDDSDYYDDSQLPVCEVTVDFVPESIVNNIINSNMDNESKQKAIRMLNTIKADIVKPDNLSNKASMAWDNWAYNLEKFNSISTDGYTVLKDFEGHFYSNILDSIEFRIIDLPKDVEFLPFSKIIDNSNIRLLPFND